MISASQCGLVYAWREARVTTPYIISNNANVMANKMRAEKNAVMNALAVAMPIVFT